MKSTVTFTETPGSVSSIHTVTPIPGDPTSYSDLRGHQDICGTQIGKTLIPIKQLNLKKHKFLKRTFKKTETLIWASIKVGSKVTKNIRERIMDLKGLGSHTFRKPLPNIVLKTSHAVPHLVLALTHEGMADLISALHLRKPSRTKSTRTARLGTQGFGDSRSSQSDTHGDCVPPCLILPVSYVDSSSAVCHLIVHYLVIVKESL